MSPERGHFFIMKVTKKTKMKVVCSSDPVEFEEQFNKAMEELAEQDPCYELREVGGSIWAIITHTVKERIAETVKEEYHMQGEKYYCSQCPLREQVTDGRVKKVPCMYAETGRANLRDECCDYFYRMLKQGKVTPTYE